MKYKKINVPSAFFYSLVTTTAIVLMGSTVPVIVGKHSRNALIKIGGKFMQLGLGLHIGHIVTNECFSLFDAVLDAVKKTKEEAAQDGEDQF